MNSGQTRSRLVEAGSVLMAAVLIAGCGSAYRSVVTPVNTSGPPAQPTSYAVVVSAPAVASPGIATIIDYSGDSVLANAPIGVGPTTFTLDGTGSNGYTLNSDGTLTNFPITSVLQGKQLTYSTLPSTANPVNLYSPSTGLWAADLTGNVADVFTSLPEVFKLAIPVSPEFTPVMITGASSTYQRTFVIDQNLTNSNLGVAGVQCNTSPTTGPVGSLTTIEVSSDTTDAPITLGKCPVYALLSPDTRRFFVLNRGDDTISVINAQDDTLDDQCPPPTGCVNQSGQTYFTHPILPLSTTAVTVTGVTPPNGTAGMTKTAGPVYAEYNSATAQLVVADYDGGTISVIDVSMDEYGNDSPTFGTTFTIPVGNNPASVTVLADGSRAYTANQTDQTVTIVTLSGHTVEKTLPIIGHPRTVVSTQNSQYGKVYVASPDSPYITILRTDLDLVDTTILVEGNVVDVRVTTQTGSSGNSNVVSRIPGFGQPCNLPPTSSNPTPAPTGTETLLQACRALP